MLPGICKKIISIEIAVCWKSLAEVPSECPSVNVALLIKQPHIVQTAKVILVESPQIKINALRPPPSTRHRILYR